MIRRRWPVMLVFVAIYWALEVGYSLAHLGRPRGGEFDPPALTRSVALSLAWGCVQWLRDSGIVASAILPGARPSVAAAAVAALRSFPALLPYRLLGLLPVLALQFGERWLVRGHVLQMAALAGGFGLAALIFRLALDAVWGLIIPLAVVERCGPLAAMSRSASLLAGNRWRLVALRIGATVTSGLPGVVTILLIGLIVRGRLAGSLRYEVWINGFLVSLIAAFWLTMTAAAYQQLIHARKGLPAEHSVADIFG